MADFPQIEVLDVNGAVALRYLKLSDEVYYGGTTHDEYLKALPFAYGPHVRVLLEGMLDLIAHIANLELLPYHDFRIQSGIGGLYHCEVIRREMHADVLAAILGCEEKTVIEHYGRLVLIAAEDSHG